MEFGASTRYYGLILNRPFDYAKAALLVTLVMFKLSDHKYESIFEEL